MKQLLEFNIEFAHIYAHDTFGKEQMASSLAAKSFIEGQVQPVGAGYALTLLIDDYNAHVNSLDVDECIRQLETLGLLPDHVAFESRLTKFQNSMLAEMSAPLRSEIESKIQATGKCPCPFLVAIWHLMRLGVFEHDQVVEPVTSRQFVASRAVVVLPFHYQSVEKRALRIIESTRFGNLVDCIDHVYF